MKVEEEQPDGVLVLERTLPASSPKCDGLVPLVAEVVEQGHSVLVFCAGL
jgi:hypothetical protein